MVKKEDIRIETANNWKESEVKETRALFTTSSVTQKPIRWERREKKMDQKKKGRKKERRKERKKG